MDALTTLTTGRDPFKIEAARIFDTCTDKVTEKQREYVKTLSYAERYAGRMPSFAAAYAAARKHR